MADKEWELMLRALGKAVDEVVFTRVAMERSAEPQQLAEKMVSSIPRRTIHDACIGLRALLDESQVEDIIVVAGSLYLLGEVRPMLQEIAAAETAGG